MEIGICNTQYSIPRFYSKYSDHFLGNENKLLLKLVGLLFACVIIFFNTTSWKILMYNSGWTIFFPTDLDKVLI